MKQGELPIERGKELSFDDDIRQWVIKAFICQFSVDKKAFASHFQKDFDAYFVEEKEHIQKCVSDGLLEIKEDKIIVTDLGKIFIRNVCMGFDWYLRQHNSHKKFSKTI